MDLHQHNSDAKHSREDAIVNLRDSLEDLDWRSIQIAERLLAPYQLTLPQVAVLSVLHREGPHLEMSQIASRTGLPPSTITSIMDRLLLRQFVQRQHHPTDRRRVTGSITDEGRNVVEELREGRRSMLTHLLENFSDEELAVLSKLAHNWAALSDQIITLREVHVR